MAAVVFSVLLCALLCRCGSMIQLLLSKSIYIRLYCCRSYGMNENAEREGERFQNLKDEYIKASEALNAEIKNLELEHLYNSTTKFKIATLRSYTVMGYNSLLTFMMTIKSKQ